MLRVVDDNTEGRHIKLFQTYLIILNKVVGVFVSLS